jgi:ferredoxin
MQAITERLRDTARSLLREDQVDVVIGYEPGWADDVVTPCFVTSEDEVERMVYDERCTQNLAKYLVGREGRLTSRFVAADARPRVALVANPGALRAIVGLIQEYQFAREDVIILGVVDGTPIGVRPDVELGEVAPADSAETQAQIQSLHEMSPAERWAWWEAQFDRCIRCYACRQVCPFCYCEECIADTNQPQWIDRAPSPAANTSWNVIRAYHLVGRCIDCGECERACPADIPLRLLNRKMIASVQEAYDYRAGTDTEAAPPLVTFRPEDADVGIR